MRYGLISDIHFGYHAGSKVNDDGVNVREQDHYEAGFLAVRAIKEIGVDVILDAGDMAEVPAPKKRAIVALIDLVNYAGVPFYSVDGNHTGLKSTSDIHIYDILANECENFKGYRRPAFDPYTKVSFVPHSYNNDEIREYIGEATNRKTEVLLGHWAADDIPYVGQVSRSDLPSGVSIFLGHYHNYRPTMQHSPTYIGSTEKTAWDQWDYPTGAAVWDSETGIYQRVEIPTREWCNVEANAEDAYEALTSNDVTDKITRLTVYATPEEYNIVDQVACKTFARVQGATQFTMRRKNPADIDQRMTEIRESLGIVPDWMAYMADAEIPKGVDRNVIIERGTQALNG